MKLYENGFITEETAMAYASQKAVVNRSIDTLKSTKGEKTSDIEGLNMDDEYGA